MFHGETHGSFSHAACLQAIQIKAHYILTATSQCLWQRLQKSLQVVDLLCKARRQQLLTWKVSSCCLLASHGTVISGMGLRNSFHLFVWQPPAAARQIHKHRISLCICFLAEDIRSGRDGNRGTGSYEMLKNRRYGFSTIQVLWQFGPPLVQCLTNVLAAGPVVFSFHRLLVSDCVWKSTCILNLPKDMFTFGSA